MSPVAIIATVFTLMLVAAGCSIIVLFGLYWALFEGYL